MAFGGTAADNTDGSSFMQAVIDYLKIDSATLHACPSNTCATVTAPTVKLTADANTKFLDTGVSSGGATFTAAKWAWPILPSGGMTNSRWCHWLMVSQAGNQAQGIDRGKPWLAARRLRSTQPKSFWVGLRPSI